MVAASANPGSVEAIGPYRIVAPLSAGGMGVVYRARNPETGQEVALKTVRLQRADLLHSIRREILALRRLQHPGVVRVLDEGVDAGVPWYAMELLEGATLRRKLDAMWPEPVAAPRANATTWAPARPRPDTADAASAPEPPRQRRGPCAAGVLPEVLTLVRRLCDALAFIHGEGVVHRDLKPENIFLRADASPVLVDFGLVSAFGGARGRESLEVGGSFAGSVHYVAPEQIDGKGVDARADLYALGCILYELVTGQPPFPGEGTEVLQKHLAQAPLSPSRLVDGVPHALEDLVLRLLAKQPRDRIGYASDVAAMLAELGAEGGGPAVAARPYLYRPELAGRADVLGELERRLDRARAGQGSCVLIAGDSGAGKTRLAVEIATSGNRRDFRVVTGECLPPETGATDGASGRGGPLHPFKPLLQAIGDRCRAAGAEVTKRLLGKRGKLLAFFEPSFALLPGQNQETEPARLSVKSSQERLVASLVETIVTFSEDEPLLLVLDDLHWADPLTLSVLLALQKGALRDARALVVGTYRSGEENEALRTLVGSPEVTRLKLGGLDRSMVASMVRDMLALPSPPESFIRFLAAQSEGNPFFVAEYLRAAISEGLLERNEAGRWQLVEGGQTRELLTEALPLPDALRELVARRFSGASGGARLLVEAAAVLGRDFDVELLAELARLAVQAALEALEELVRKHVVEEGKPGRFRFAHDKLREVAYEALSAERRAALHRAAAEALEARHRATDTYELIFPLLAHHWAQAGEPSKTRDYLEKAGERSLRTGANAEAADFFRRALAVAEKVPGGVDSARRADWERKLGEALYGIGDVAGCKEHLLRAMAALGWPMPESRAAWTRMLLAQLGHQAAHLMLPERWVVARAERRAALAVVALTAARLSECYYFNQEMLPTVACSLLAVNLAERAGRGEEMRRIYGNLGYLAGLGRLHVLARRYFALATGAGQAVEDPGGVAFGFILESMYHVTFGRYARAAERAHQALRALPGAWNARESAIEKLESGYVPPEVYLAKNLIAHVDFYEGRLERSLQRLVEVRGLARAQSNVQYEAWTELDMARGLIAVDRLDEAVGLLTHAQRLLAGRGDKSSELQSYGMLATAHLLRGELELAREVADGVAALVRDVQPAVFTEGCGFEGIALVYLAAWERAGRGARELAQRAWSACGVLSRFALLFPLAKPAALRCLGKAHWLAGHPQRARAKLRASLESAQRLGMSYDAALAQVELGRTARDPAERERLLREAREALERLGTTSALRALGPRE